MKQVYYKQNEKFEYEFFNDKECKEAFEFNGEDKNLYIELKNGDITPLIVLHNNIEFNKKNEVLNIFCCGINSQLALHFGEYISGVDELNSQGYGIEPSEVQYYFLNLPNYNEIFSGYMFNNFHSIVSNYSKYIPKDCLVMFLNEVDLKNYTEGYKNRFPNRHIGLYINDGKNKTTFTANNTASLVSGIEEIKQNKKVILFTPELTSTNIKQINDTAKVLKENFGIEWVGVFAELCFIENPPPAWAVIGEDGYFGVMVNGKLKNAYFDKLITTNATGLLEPQESEHLQVIDCKEIFEEYIKTNE